MRRWVKACQETAANSESAADPSTKAQQECHSLKVTEQEPEAAEPGLRCGSFCILLRLHGQKGWCLPSMSSHPTGSMEQCSGVT